MKTIRPFLVLLLTAAVLALAPACVRRTIAVFSDPPGATVYLDGREVGRTPVARIPFHFYGVREFALHKRGYLCERRVVDIDTPWYSCFPVDIFSELVVPWDIRDHRDFYFALKRTAPIETSVLRRHAHQTREIARARILAAQRQADYRPRKYIVEGAPKHFILFAPFTSPPRVDWVFPQEPEPKKKPEADQ